jgi:hypothetical protein
MSKLNPSVAFIICSERGVVEKQSILFAKSLRKFGGVLKDSPIYSISPREGFSISETTLVAFNNLQVNHVEKNINKEFRDYIFANKIAACSYYEEKLEEDILIFSDSDQLVLGSLDEFLLDEQTDAALQYVAKKGIGSTGRDENASYWHRLFLLTGVELPVYSKTAEGEKIYRYFNAGLIIAKRKLGLFKQWEQNFKKVMAEQLLPNQGLFFVEQSILSATLSAMALKINILSEGYNYHLLKQTDEKEALKKIATGKIKMLHYHRSFDEPNRWSVPNEFANSFPLKWIKKELINSEINTNPFIHQWEKVIYQNKEKIIDLLKKNK